jgi:hypothetical protein
MLCYYADWHYAECRILFTFMLNVVLLSVIMLSVVMLNVVMLSVVAPGKQPSLFCLCVDDRKGFVY